MDRPACRINLSTPLLVTSLALAFAWPAHAQPAFDRSGPTQSGAPGLEPLQADPEWCPAPADIDEEALYRGVEGL
ncbi:MAG: hypothetical protein JNJ59_20225, partial [Deltaproteobacteria bacterium]|nr:hypothetical protein [Deltaproteobacteria bacterium]